MSPPHRRAAGLLLAGVLTVAVGLALAAAGRGPALAQETVDVRGAVVNGTEDAEFLQEVLVLLLVSDDAGALVFTGQAAAGPDGGFRFEDVPRTVQGAYALSVDYEGVFYGSSFSFQEVLDQVRLTVYETTKDSSVVRVTRQVLVIGGVSKNDREISAIEFVQLANNSDRTLSPDLSNPGTLSFLRFALPLQSSGLSVRSNLPGGDVVSIGTGFALTSPVLPGGHNVEFSFRFPYQGDSISYRQSLPQGADVYQVLLPQEWAQVQVQPLRPVSPVNIGGSEFLVWEERDFARGQGTVLQLTNLPQPGLASRLQGSITDGTFWKAAIPSAVGAVLALLLLLGGLKTSRPASFPVGADGAELDSNLAQREALVREVASLDEEFQQGALAEAEYLRRREALLTRIRRSSGPVDEAGESAT